MEPLSKIVVMAMNEITCGTFKRLPKLAATGLLHDFQYAWLRRFNIPYKFEMLDFARCLCNTENKSVFTTTRCNNIEEIRNTFSYYIERWYKDDNRIVTAISFDGKEIKTEWMELADYLKACGE